MIEPGGSSYSDGDRCLRWHFRTSACYDWIQEHIEHGRNSRSALRAAIFGPAIADFDALLLLRRNALPAADCAAQGAKALAEAARRRGFAAMDPGAARPVAEVPPPVANGGREGPDTRARAVLRAVPEGGGSPRLSPSRLWWTSS